ncbi:hypothetical protein V6N13_107990 [Hibiscus sabdariffa]|uniref:Uncharacterized protein n=1 Tax=Hibiscus sabdariffa TaxID=183260 RepID=A0ABR2SQW0_9ROSI
MEKASVFTFMEEATCSFSEANLLGKGGFGLVHKGTLHSNSAHFRSWNSYSLQRFQVHNCPSNRKLRSKGKRLMWLPELLAHSATEYTSSVLCIRSGSSRAFDRTLCCRVKPGTK